MSTTKGHRWVSVWFLVFFHRILSSYYKIIWIVHVVDRLLIGQQVCFHNAMKHKNDVRNMVCCFQVVRIYSFMKEIKVYLSASYIVFLFVKTENNFIKEIKHVLRAFIAWWKTRQSLWEFSSRWKPSAASQGGFHWSALKFSHTFALPHWAMKARRTCFISLIPV